MLTEALRAARIQAGPNASARETDLSRKRSFGRARTTRC